MHVEAVSAGMSRVAAPMAWPYFSTGSPAAMKRVASLWPKGTASRLVTFSLATGAPGRNAGGGDDDIVARMQADHARRRLGRHV